MLTDTQWDYLLELSGGPRNYHGLDINVLNSLVGSGHAKIVRGKWSLTIKGKRALATVIHA